MPGSWNLLFDDEFNGTSLNTSNWSTGWFGSGITGTVNPSLESDCYDPSQDVVSGGALTISAVQQSETCDGAIEPDSSGLISTNGKFQFTYGAFEARIWMPGSGSTVADWPASGPTGRTGPRMARSTLPRACPDRSATTSTTLAAVLVAAEQ